MLSFLVIIYYRAFLLYNIMATDVYLCTEYYLCILSIRKGTKASRNGCIVY